MRGSEEEGERGDEMERDVGGGEGVTEVGEGRGRER